ncbi:angiopoietin-related protein 2-like [Lucilia sericata]|uniref:angiopoietin-related protein 2-like n=1 Tax=Lucilia sericata TaxID=13632 RepID=UPI0018A7F10B|nr:angiopoietin-related protein 2-like [Lucilia sericata]
MFLKYLISTIFFCIISFGNGICEDCNLDEVHLHLFGQIENIKQSLQIVNNRMDVINDRYSSIIDKKETCENPPKPSRSMFDIRFDSLPKHCATNAVPPSSCAEATKCTRTSGIYNITDYRYSNQTFTVYCDYDYNDGDWLYFLTRFNGRENFKRTWNEYVYGFGNVANEYWLGLERLYALTNYYGPQELIVYIENFEGIAKYARYSDFVIGNASEKYKLKTLGEYSGTAGDSMSNQFGCYFTTYDNDNDMNDPLNCAQEYGGGFWFNSCTTANPTGLYKRGLHIYNGDNGDIGSFWLDFGGWNYSHKTIIFMIRRKSAIKLK